ncbi:MAG: endo-1,4-beta-xylanase [Acetatifactor sp.]|nr:endo-1,4-beta-xylanase [Acetatifactor sp.]
MRRKLKSTMAAVLAVGALLTAGVTCGSGCLAAEADTNLIACPDFAQEDDISVWYRDRGGATITAETDTEPIYGDVTSYGKITDRSSNYECFSQDVTGLVEKDKDYIYSFYVMLDPVDYADAPSQQRNVEISPYITADGNTIYSQGCSGTVSQVLEPGVWTHFTGVYTPSWSGNLEQVVIRILEQGTNYGQGEGVMGTYYMTGMELKEQGVRESIIQTDVPRLRDVVPGALDQDFIIGTSIVNSDLKDVDTMALVTRHFNAITLGNELKPDAMFGYSNNQCPGTETVTLNGEELVVPKLDYTRAERTLNAIYDWNQSHPEDLIKVRGHVLVWHSQTPEWWFHEDYDAGKPYADTETMNRRLEWYIKTMAEHFTGEDSKYHGMFYGWDVVNEAVSDGGSRYRNAGEKSSWWAVYQSNEFIINAFRYANQYMDPEVELYYNDYNEWVSNKRVGIEQLLKDVKEAEGTRIDGMGMQGHYQTVGSPSMEEFSKAARAYAAIVGQVQITELDMKASNAYDGTAATQEAEFATQGQRYKELYDTVKSLREEGVNITNITLWGVVDKDSWLQTFNSVGGAADGVQRQCPLLFDDYYQVKPAFWAFADDARLETVGEEAEPVKEETVESSDEETSVEPVQESAQEPESQDTEESAEPEQPQTPQKEGSGKLLYGIGVVCAVLVAGIAGIILIRRRKRDS